MISGVAGTECNSRHFSSPINPSTHLPINLFSSIGRYCFIAAGAVVTKNVPDYAFIVGVPGNQKGWMSRHGHVLQPGKDGLMVCPESKFRYQEVSSGILKCLDLDEETPLSEEQNQGHKRYDEFKK